MLSLQFSAFTLHFVCIFVQLNSYLSILYSKTCRAQLFYLACKYSMRNIFTLLFLCVFWPAIGNAQENPYVFSHLKEKDGLSNNTIFSFCKDRRGIFWIGTQNGLNRFDGSNFYAYKVKKNANSIPDATIMSLCEDKKGNIWGATNNGIFCFNLNENKFTNYFPLDNTISNNFLNILCDSKGNIWAGGWIHLLKFDAANNSFKKVVQLSSYDSARQYSMRKNCLIMDPAENGLWMATRSGMFYYDINKNQLLKPGSSNNPLFEQVNVEAFAKSPAGHYWYFNNVTKDITAFDPLTKKILFKINVKKYTPDAFCTTIFEDKGNRLWLSTWSSEVLVIDYKNNKIANITTHKDDPLSICNGFFWTVLEDENATLWFGTLNGISKCNPDKNIYKPYRLPETIDALKNTAITIVREDTIDNSLWIVTLDRHLIHYKKDKDSYEVFDLAKSKTDNKGGMIGEIFTLSLLKDKIVLTSGNGMWQLLRGKKELEPFNFMVPAYPDFKANHFVASGDSVFYLSDSRKVVYFNKITGETKFYENASATLPNGSVAFVGKMLLDSKNRLWTYPSNAWIMGIVNDKLQPVLISKDDNGKPIGYFSSIEADNNNNIWLANQVTGVYRFNTITQAIKKWDQSDGLDVSVANTAIPDLYGQVWCAKANKVSVLMQGTNGVYNFALPIGETTSPYNNASERMKNGNIILSIYNDLIEFKSQQLQQAPVKIEPQISLVNIADSNYLVADKKSLVLNHQQNNVRFRFGIYTDKEVFPYDMEYMLDGAEHNWTKAAGNNQATYNNLAPGKYTFRVRAKGKNNGWQSGEANFVIIIEAPFYKRIWFFILVGLLICGAIIFIYRYRLAQKERLLMLENKAQMLEKEKAVVMYDSLKQQLNPHFLFNSLTSLSGLIDTNQQMAGEFLEQMSGIYRYILKNSESETVLLKDEIEFVKLYINLQQTRFKKGLLVNITVPEEYLHYKIAPVTLQNLIENAIKHNVIDTDSPLVIDIFTEEDYLVVKNNLQKKNMVETSNKKGLAQFVSLYKYLSGLPVLINETEKEFIIRIPLI